MAEDSLLHPPAAGGAAAAPADPPRAGLFDITGEFVGAWSQPLQATLLIAAERIETAVLGDLPDVAIPSTGGAPATVDDLLIRAELQPVDGAGGVLGISGPTFLRPDSLLPIAARMRFDEADAASLDAEGLWGDTALHEMLHCLGFGTLWAVKDLVALAGGGYPAFLTSGRVDAPRRRRRAASRAR